MAGVVKPSVEDRGQAAKVAVVLVVRGRELPIGPVDGRGCDLQLVDDLARLRLAAARLGWELRLVEVDDDLRDLIELVGLAEPLGI